MTNLKDSNLAFSSSGNGAPVVLIHGVGLSSESWQHQVQALSRRFKVFAVDLPGHGQTTGVDHQLSMTKLCNWITRFCEHVVQKPCVLVGHSLGALIAIHTAARNSSSIKGMAALSAVHNRDAKALEAVQNRARQLHVSGSLQHVADAPVTRWFGDPPPLQYETMAQQCRQWLSQNNLAGYASAYRVFAEETGPSPSILEKILVPALFVTGALDPNSTPEMSHQMANHCPNSEAVIVNDAKHMLQMTHADEISALLTRFVRRCY
ncbi:MAG: alpha/beta hydrolase [Pseudomonadota bacterium]